VGGGVASAAILGLGWTLLTNGYPIVYCPPRCPEAAPLSDVAHLASIVFGIAAPCGSRLLRIEVRSATEGEISTAAPGIASRHGRQYLTMCPFVSLEVLGIDGPPERGDR
jgi:hypothetical protein